MVAPLSRLIGKLFARPQSRRDRRRAARLGLEPLEGRDVPAVTFTIETLSDATEGGGAGQFRVTANGDAVDFTNTVYALITSLGGTASAGTDYTISPSANNYLTFNSPGATATVTVTPVDDSAVEGDETVSITVKRYQMYPMGEPGTGTLTLHDNDFPPPPPPPPSISVVALGDVEEGGTAAAFRFSRSGDTSAGLTVRYHVDETDDDFIATPETDYQPLGEGETPGVVTFAPGVATVDVTIATVADNKIEENEEVRLTLLPSDATPEQYTVADADPAIVAILDDPPTISWSAEWINSGGTIGYITLMRSGGNTDEPLTAWFEPEGVAEIDGEEVTVTIGATAVFASGQTSIVVTMLGAVVENVFTIQMQNAAPQGQRADRSAQLDDFMDSSPGAGARQAAFILQPGNLPQPLHYNEWLYLKAIVRGPFEGYHNRDDWMIAKTAAMTILAGATIDWQTVPGALGPQAGTLGAAVGSAAVLPPADWQRTDARVQQLIADLGSTAYAVRAAAQDNLTVLLNRLIARGDFGQYLMVYDRMRAAAATTADPEQYSRLQLLIGANSHGMALEKYFVWKVRAAAAAAGWVPLFSPNPTP